MIYTPCLKVLLKDLICNFPLLKMTYSAVFYIKIYFFFTVNASCAVDMFKPIFEHSIIVVHPRLVQISPAKRVN